MSTCIPGFCVGCAPRQANSSGRVGGTGPPRAGLPEGRTVSLWALRGLACPLQAGGGCTEPRGQQGNLETGGPPERVTLDSPKATGEHTHAHTQACFLISSVQSLSRVQLFATPWTARQASLSITNSQSLLKPMSIELVMPSNHLILCHPLLLLPSIFPRIRVFSNESVLYIRWPTYWSFSISPSNEHSVLISFRIDRLDLFGVQGTLKSLL